jgi:hypothetical protein
MRIQASRRRPGGPVARAVIAALLVFAGLVAGCGALGSSPKPSSCDGISSLAGGCDPDQPAFAGTTCAEVGAEWGTIVDQRILAVIHGPSNVNGNARSVNTKNAMVLAFIRAAQHMEALGILDDCHSAEFIGAAEPNFSPELRSSVGAAMYDGEPVVTYTDFVTDALSTVGSLDHP